MIWMHSLRMFADLSFFGMFAGAAAFYLLQRIGGMDTQILPRSLLGFGILSLIYGISFLYREKGKKRFFLLPFLALSFMGAAGCLAELVVLVPGAAYVATMIIKREYPLFWSRQADLFQAFWKFALILGGFLLLLGQWKIFLQITLPLAVCTAAGLILLLRSLRHEPKVYLGRKFQSENVIATGLFFLLFFVLSSPSVIHGGALVYQWFYQQILLPPLLILVRLMGFLIGMLLEGILWFLSLFSISRQIAEPLAQALKSGENLWKPALVSQEGGGSLIFSIVRVVIVLFVAAGIYFFFRWLASHKNEDQGEIMGFSVEQTGMKPTQHKTGKSDSFWVRQIRREYRNYMKLCQEKGISIKASTTSRDLQENHERNPQICGQCQELRQIYLDARYGQRADFQSAKRFREVYKEIKKKL